MFGFLFKLVNMINGWEVELVGGLLYLASVAVLTIYDGRYFEQNY